MRKNLLYIGILLSCLFSDTVMAGSITINNEPQEQPRYPVPSAQHGSHGQHSGPPSTGARRTPGPHSSITANHEQQIQPHIASPTSSGSSPPYPGQTSPGKSGTE